MISLLLLPCITGLILTAIHVYFGQQVLRRNVIFVDLALAQWAAFGGIIALINHIEPQSISGYLISAAATMAAAAIIAITPKQIRNKSPEAFIGILYVTATALALATLSKSPLEGTLLKEMLVGDILMVTSSDIISMTILYAIIALIHIITKPILSNDNSRVAEFIFYATFGLVVASSVKIGGVLLIFSYLIIPAWCTLFINTSPIKRLLIGWLIGTLTTTAGCATSVLLDIPTGTSIVLCFSIPVILTCLLKR